MTFGQNQAEFLHHLLESVHIEDAEWGYCIRCLPRQFHPCSVRARIVARMLEIGHLDALEAAKVQKGRACACGKKQDVPGGGVAW